MMNVHFGETESYYEVTPDEKAELAHWLDTVVVAAEPEEVTGNFFIDNFISDEKWWDTPLGKVNAIMLRDQYSEFYKPEDTTDVVIAGGEIWESNTDKGILFNVARDPLPGTYSTKYDIGLMSKTMSGDPRYTGLAYVSIEPPHDRCQDYNFLFRFNIKKDFGYRMFDDDITYVLQHERDVVMATFACENIDVTKGMLMHRPLSQETFQFASLQRHVRFVGDILGLEIPDFLNV